VIEREAAIAAKRTPTRSPASPPTSPRRSSRVRSTSSARRAPC
jgi:hypothetical protein